MVRTIVGLDPEDKAWLDRKAREEKVPMAQIVRRAVRRYRKESEKAAPSIERLLQKTKGTWKAGDGLSYQQHMREEWEAQ